MLPIDPNPSWKMRRRAVFSSLVFGMSIVIYTAIRWDSTSLAETLALGGFGMIGAGCTLIKRGTNTWVAIGGLVA